MASWTKSEKIKHAVIERINIIKNDEKATIQMIEESIIFLQRQCIKDSVVADYLSNLVLKNPGKYYSRAGMKAILFPYSEWFVMNGNIPNEFLSSRLLVAQMIQEWKLLF